ncbi:MaoC family dehydratase N-terminal domain-containing protein [Pseudomonas schmalbachii]|uniref:MaoC family dehydratase N-terminal domain-containing protein n=1 Tax=Pseudomonas schmalbachii TaxID=2816993 RepID=A0ABS3TUR8_9PSED|nr:MaoC family dehydratase N-terminal domain-containing protein [Pseudomonas schmalbachii]MBO3277402.1 MaoC family dehydratase N-terminal domain-containing protein [Pseudomonas schmalbachii]
MADKSLIGHVTTQGSVEVEKGKLRFFAKAIGETDPVYTDEAVAKAAGHKSLPVPPTMLMPLMSEIRGDIGGLMKLLGWDLGRILHAEQSFTYHKMAYAGDVLSFETRISDVYEKKGGALQFVVQESRVTNQDGEHIADVRNSLVHR